MDHVPTNPVETSRIECAGGWVQNGRVNGVLGVSRSFGDIMFKSYDPKENKNAKFVKKITWKRFNLISSKIKYTAGQHFVLDQTAAKIIQKKKIPTYIVGSITAIDNILKSKNFKGTCIKG